MPTYEYKVIPAPTKGLKAKGIRTAEARFSHAIETLMNEQASDGWEYQRAETLPSVERSGLTSSTTEWRNVLVFRRARQDDAGAFAPDLLPAPATVKTAEQTARSEDAAKPDAPEPDPEKTPAEDSKPETETAEEADDTKAEKPPLVAKRND